MDTGGMTLATWSFLAAALAYALVFGRVAHLGFLAAPRIVEQVTVAIAFVATASWAVIECVTGAWLNLPWLQLAARAADAARYLAWVVLMRALIRSGEGASIVSGATWVVRGAWALAIAHVALYVLVPERAFGAVSDVGRYMHMASMGLSVCVLILLEQVYRNVTEDSRWNVKPLCLGLGGAFAFDLYLHSQSVLFGRLDFDAQAVRGFVHALVAPLLFLAVTRRPDWFAKIRVSRHVAFHSATLLIAGAYLVFISAVGYYVRYFGGEWGKALQVALVAAALLVLMVLAMSGAVRARLRVFLGKNFFRYRYDYREEWLRFTQTLSAQDSPQAMGEQVVRGLANMLESPGGALWLQKGDSKSFAQVARWNLAAVEALEAQDSAFSGFLRDSGWVINLEEFRSFPRRYGALQLPNWLASLEQAWLVVPLAARQELIGFVVLASARTRVEVNWEVNDLLKTAGRQAASYLAQMLATEALLEARKFDAFNRMSAFVVHDLKNIVTQLSLMMKNAKRLAGNPEFQQDMLMTVEHSLDRMRQMMMQLREGATPVGSSHGVELEALIARIAKVASDRGRHLEVTIAEPVQTRGHSERLERILGHMVQNAFDATDPQGRVWIELARASGQARVVVGDTGQGMTEAFIRDRLFKPFQSTKQAGMGIGAYESYQYVQELGGRIQVDSKPGAGTRITILLPLFEATKQSDLLRADPS